MTTDELLEVISRLLPDFRCRKMTGRAHTVEATYRWPRQHRRHYRKRKLMQPGYRACSIELNNEQLKTVGLGGFRTYNLADPSSLTRLVDDARSQLANDAFRTTNS